MVSLKPFSMYASSQPTHSAHLALIAAAFDVGFNLSCWIGLDSLILIPLYSGCIVALNILVFHVPTSQHLCLLLLTLLARESDLER